MTRKTRSRQLRIHSAFQSGYCSVCQIPYNCLEDHIRSKKHQKFIGDDANFISLKAFDDQDTSLASFLALDGVNAIEVNRNSCGYSRQPRRKKMPRRTRTVSLMCDRVKDSPLSPVGSDSGHHLRSRKNINYMTPPLDDDSLTEKPELVKEYRELRSSSRLLAKITDQIVENDEVWNSGRPKRSCNRQRISADERLVVDNKSYYKVEVLPTKLRSGAPPINSELVRRHEPSANDEKDDKGLIVKFKKLRSSELFRLNNEAENFLFPKKDETSGDNMEEDITGKSIKNETTSLSNDTDDSMSREIKVEDEESMHSTCSENKGKRRRRTHAEAFIMDNQKYYKFETPGSRLRYQGSFLSPFNWKMKNNGDCCKSEKDHHKEVKIDYNFKINLDEYNFSFESVPRNTAWFKAFQRRDTGEEKYAYLSDDNYWNPLLLPYQIGHLPSLDPRVCISQYNQVRRCLMEPLSASTSAGCSTPDTSNSASSLDPACNQDEDSKISATMTEASSSSTLDDLRPSPSKRGRSSKAAASGSDNGKNPRKSPRQHASTLAILSSLIHQRRRKSRRSDGTGSRNSLPTILEEPKYMKSPKQQRLTLDYLALAKSVEEELEAACAVNLGDLEVDHNDAIDFRSRVDIIDLLGVYDSSRGKDTKASTKRFFSGKPGRKPGRKKKKNLTGWPNRNRRSRRDHQIKEEDESTIDSVSMNADSEENEDVCENMISTDSIKKTDSKLNSVNNNKNDQSSLVVVSAEGSTNNCDFKNEDRVGRTDRLNKCDDSSGKVLNKVNSEGFNIDLQYQPYVRVQKLDKNRIGDKSGPGRRSNSPKRTNRGQRRMPASPKSPRMLRRPRGQWYRER